MPGSAQQKPTDSHGPAAASIHRIRSDHADFSGRQVVALEFIATNLAQIIEARVNPAPITPETMIYAEAAIALRVSEKLLEAMVGDGRLKLGRHYVKVGSNVRFKRNLVDLIFEDQRSINDDVYEESKTEKVNKSRPTKSQKSTGSDRSAFNSNYT